jgi:undecaprenyl-diphosphatase
VRRTTALLAAAGAAATLLAALGVMTHERMTDDLDARAERFARRGPRRRRKARQRIALAATQPGEPYTHFPLSTLIALLVARRMGFKRGAPVAAASIGGVLAHQGVKLFYGRERPIAAVLRGKKEPAFPSGHTTNSTAVCATAAYVLLREKMAPPALVFPAAVAIPLVVGWSRVELEQHWLTDVVGGWIAGLGIAALCAASYESVRVTTR